MGRRAAIGLALLAALLAVAPAGAAAGEQTQEAGAKEFRVLVFSRTATFRHLSIATGIDTIRELGEANGFAVDATEDPALFNEQNLRRYRVVLFLNTTGDVLDEAGQGGLRDYIESGGGYAGIHSASDTEHEWPFYEKLVGAHFRSHPLQQLATIVNEDPANPATAHLPAQFTVFDEFYSFGSNPREDVRVLLSIDESTYLPDPNTTNLAGSFVSGYMGDHPMSWCHDNLGGRAFYTALGHEAHLYAEAWYRRHILEGIRLAAGEVEGKCTAPPDTQVSLDLGQRRLTFGTDRRTGLALRCPADEASDPCSGTVMLKGRRADSVKQSVALARGRFEIAAGEIDLARLRISRRSERRLATGELSRRARIVAKVRDRAGNRARIRGPVRLSVAQP